MAFADTLLSPVCVTANLYALDLVPSTAEAAAEQTATASDEPSAAQDETASASPRDSFVERLVTSPYFTDLNVFHTIVVNTKPDRSITAADQSRLPGVDLMELGLRIFQTPNSNEDALRGAREMYIAGLLLYADVRKFPAPERFTGRAAEIRFDKAVAEGTKNFSRIVFGDLPENKLHDALRHNAFLFRDAYLREADFRKTVLIRTNLSFADLTSANLRAVFLHGANLSGANLTKANLKFAILIRADLYGATLHGADLTMADLDGAGLEHVDLGDVNLTGVDLYSVKRY